MPRKEQCSAYHEMADLPVAVGPKMADRLSVSLFPSLVRRKNFFKLTPVILLEFADVTCKPGDRKKFCILVTGHDHPRYFYKERLEIVAKAVAGLKDGSYEIISVGAAN